MFCENCGNKMEEGLAFCENCGTKLNGIKVLKTKKPLFFKKKLFVILGVVLFVLLGFTYIYYYLLKSDDFNVSSAVVNIYCEGATDEQSTGGSGTIFSEDGLIITNAHIIPEGAFDAEGNSIVTCFVTLPNPDDGSAEEIYYAYPLQPGELGEEYDIAFFQIDDVYYDFEEKKAYGEYPKKFPAYTDKKVCHESEIKLGEPVRVYGYPSLSGGEVLTITDGIVSSLLLDEGLIVTSAKISYGNSGGLAVDSHGCMIGIPSMTNSDDNESFGIIISNDLILEFLEKITKE